MSQSVPDRCCVNCHFLTKMPSVGGFSVDEPTRKELLDQATQSTTTETPKHTIDKYRCYEGVWTGVGVSQDGKYDLSRLIQDRDESCPFYPYMPGREQDLILIEDMERRETGRREAKRDRMLVKIGVWIAATALVLNLGWSIGWNIWEHFNPPKMAPKQAATPATQPDRPSCP